MKSSTYYKLSAVLKELQSERNQLQGQIDENNLQIYETQSFALELLGKEEDDFKFFSPRKMKDIHRDELKQFDEKKSEYVNRNKELIIQRDKLDSIIDVLVEVSEEYREEQEKDNDLEKETESNASDDSDNGVESEKDGEDVHSDSETYIDLNDLEIDEETNESSEYSDLSELEITSSDLQKNVLDNLFDVKHRIELGDKFIRQDPMRTKQEIAAACKKLNDVIDYMQGCNPTENCSSESEE
ncbi:MAG: hypothetical protein NC092_05590 [Butyrivibrio sp.]|nr:hypothetical protein [Butyrivibrio sp.]